jgi:hypothetical protein
VALPDCGLAVANYLAGKTCGGVVLALGANLFAGPTRSIDRTPSEAVFCLETGGAAPSPYLGTGRQAFYRASVQVMVRGPVGEHQAGADLARGVLETLNQAPVPGFVATFARDSAPAYLGTDDDDRPSWSINFELEHVATLG